MGRLSRSARATSEFYAKYSGGTPRWVVTHLIKEHGMVEAEVVRCVKEFGDTEQENLRLEESSSQRPKLL
jgi:hypothetical protein